MLKTVGFSENKIIAGIDEAGRGPVVGPLVLAVVFATPAQIKQLEDLGVNDSKQLTEFKRNELFKQIPKIVTGYDIISVTPREIDAALKSPSSNLNKLEAQISAKLLLNKKFDLCYIDLPGRDARSYEISIKKTIGKEKNLIAENKADETYIVVGAASILAKVTRDKEIEKISKKLKQDVGSGYPSDPKTKEFIKNNWHKTTYTCIRRTWQTVKAYESRAVQQKLDSFGK